MYNDYFGFRSAPFSATPDPDIYYSTLLHEEVLATLQYGVTAKKGLVVITGEAGTGKTTLLRKFLHAAGPAVHSVFVFNTQINFDQLLRFMLRDLDLACEADDRATMIDVLNGYLVQRLEAGHIVCLLIDEAQNLCGETLEGLRLLSNLETGKEKLLQIVLVGQPELEEKLGRVELRHLKQRVALQCRLAALPESEAGLYVDFRLKAAGYQGKGLFRADAVERIAFYSRGLPRLINIICDNALLAAYGGSRKEISGAVIEEAAGDLRLAQRMEFQPQPKPASPRQSEFFSENEERIVPEEVWQSRLMLNEIAFGQEEHQVGPTRKSQAGLIMATLFAFILFCGGGAFIYSAQGRHYLPYLGSSLENLIRDSSVEIVPDEHQPRIHKDAPAPTVPSALPRTAQEQGEEPQFPPKMDDPRPSLSSTNKGAESTPRESTTEASEPAKKRLPLRASNDPGGKSIELAVARAIQNRAIDGVSVSVGGGMVYLDGSVASERQKAMAERAARSIREVKNVKNRLTVDRF